jgi:O-antigen/teichoic acid export membrane protein
MSEVNKELRNNYFFSSFFWSTVSKLLNAISGFITVPLLLGYFGKAEYGLLSIATACNGYMHLMDLGMNTGAIKFFSQWAAEGNRGKIYRVARTNICFYIIISLINVFGLLCLAVWGERFFAVSHDQFLQLRTCFFILALFSVISWGSTAFHQLLIADKQIAFTMKVHCIQSLLKLTLIGITLADGLSLSSYFFWLTSLVVIASVPYIYKCKKDMLIDSIIPLQEWSEFKIVLTYSLSIFALSLFQVTASQSRPILLSVFSGNGADAVADYRIVEVIPSFVIMLSGSFLSVFLPKSSELIVHNNQEEITAFVKKWTSLTTIIVCILCFPFVISNTAVISAYVGSSYSYLGKWMALWCVFLIVQLHSTPAFSLVLATGRTKVLVWSTAVACLVSMLVNVSLCRVVPVGSAVIGYTTYMILLVMVYYLYFYKKYLGLGRWMLIKAFFKPVILAAFATIVPIIIDLKASSFASFILDERIECVILFVVNALLWLISYLIALKSFHMLPSLKILKNAHH